MAIYIPVLVHPAVICSGYDNQATCLVVYLCGI